MTLQGRRAIVTGGAAGIGLGIVQELVAEGVEVIIHDLDGPAAAAAAKSLNAAGGRVTAVELDVRDRGLVRTAVNRAIEEGGVDILVNNAGINVVKAPLAVTDEEWDAIVGVNLTAVWTYCQAVGRHMMERRGGSIVNVTSVAAVLAHYQRAPYHATKGGVAMLTKALALDFGDYGVRVNAVGPGSVAETGIGKRPGALRAEGALALTPLRRRATAREIGRAVVFLSSDDAGFITGHTLMVDGGMSIGTQIGASWVPPAARKPARPKRTVTSNSSKSAKSA